MTHMHEYTPEELPVSDETAQILHEIVSSNYPSEVRRAAAAKTFVRAIRSGAITEAEHDIIKAERDVKLSTMTVDPNAIPEDIPESLSVAMPNQWSPTAGMTDEGVERERDWAERAYKD